MHIGNFVEFETSMIRIAWKSLILLGFIICLIFPGCGERERPIDELVRQAESLLDEGQIENAILILERCQERDSGRVDVLEPLAFAYSANGDPIMAAFTFKRISELAPGRAEYLLYAAESLLEAKDIKGAVATYEEYLVKRPEDRAVWITLGELLQANGRLSEALEAYLEAEQIEPRARQQVAIGELYLRRQNLAQAQVWFARALTGDSDFRDEALLGLLETAIRSKRFSEAEALLTQIDAEYPGRVDQTPLESVRDQLEEWRRRREAAQEALAALEARQREAAPAETASPPEVAQVIPELQEPPGEIPAEEPVETEPLELARPETEQRPAEQPAVERPAAPSPDNHLALARQFREAGQWMEAIRHYKQALVENDNQPWIWAELSEAYLQTGNDRWARATANEAVRRDPDNPKFVLQYLRAAQRTMEPERVVREMEDAYRRFPNQPEIILVLARAYSDQGNIRNARLLFRNFLQLAAPDHPSRPSAQAELERLGG